VDLTSRLRSIVKSDPSKEVRELTYEPDDGYRTAAGLDPDHVASALGGRRVSTRFGECMVIDRRYESDRWHGDVRIGDCTLDDFESLHVLDPALERGPALAGPALPRTVFIDLETTGLSGGAGTVAFLVGCGYFDLGAFQVRQFLLMSHSAERALLAAVAEFFDDAELIVTYNGKTFDVPVMETRWLFHRMEMPSIGGPGGVPHFDMLHPARRLWKKRSGAPVASDFSRTDAGSSRTDVNDDGGCRLSTLERRLFDVQRIGDVPGMDIPSRFFRFVRSGDPRPLEPVLEHNRIDLVSLAAVTARALQLARDGGDACRDCAEALALGKIFERAEHFGRAETCYRHAAESTEPVIRAEALFHLAVRLRRDRRFVDAAATWRALLALTTPRSMGYGRLSDLRRIAVEALAIHQEHRAKDFAGARELAFASLEEADGRRADGVRHRIARLDRKLARPQNALLW
jgi:uncharacterized protein YprB with RNaseH-like and TPR domain